MAWETFKTCLSLEQLSLIYKLIICSENSILFARTEVMSVPRNALQLFWVGAKGFDLSRQVIEISHWVAKVLLTLILNFSSFSFLDCCYASQTGEANIKGIISWRTTIANLANTQQCPYESFSLNGTTSKFGNATRQCLPNFRNGAVWQHPNIDQCGYKSATTQVLEDIAKVSRASPKWTERPANLGCRSTIYQRCYNSCWV